MNRAQWHKFSTQLRDVPANQVPFDTLTNSSVSVALDDYIPPISDSDFLNDVRQGVSSENRYADQTLCFVVYRDGEYLIILY